MDPTASIRKLGFRKWYERELIKSHAALVTCFLCALTVVALLEEVRFVQFGWRTLGMLGVVFGAVSGGWYSWRRYITTLHRAERYGQRSSCPGCRAYGRFRILATGVETSIEDPDGGEPVPDTAWLRVQCSRCGTAWRMPD